MDELLIYVVSCIIIIGAFFCLTAAIGLIRLPDIYSRMHAASKAGTLGSGLMLIALAIFADDSATTMRALAGVVFFILTAPVSAHLLAKAAYSVGYRMANISVIDEMSKK